MGDLLGMKILLISLVILSVLFISSLIIYYHFYKKALLLLYAAKLDPIGLSYYPTARYEGEVNAQGRLKPSVMFYGDSRALSWTNPTLDSYHFINRAIGGQTSVQIVSRFQQHIVPHRPDIIIVQMCVNDLKMVSLFANKKREIIENCKNNLQQFIQQADEIKAKVILTTIFPLGDISIAYKLLGTQEQPIIDAIDEVNLYIKSLASEKTLIFDAYHFLKGEGRKIAPEYSRDWLHLNDKGYEMLNRELMQYL